MLKKSFLFAALVVGCMGFAACDLYVEDDGYSYCDEWGCYWCDDWGCYDIAEPGGSCDTNFDCAEGCFCDNGTCVEAGFCQRDSDCGPGMRCDDRNSCVPSDDPDASCAIHNDCPLGKFCDFGSGYCLPSPTCNVDSDCPPAYDCDDRGTCIPAFCEDNTQCAQGAFCDENLSECTDSGTCIVDGDCGEGFECDEARSTCIPDDGLCESDAECGEFSTCNLDTGACEAVACADVTDENACFERADCAPIYRGINCTDPNGNLCSAQEANCQCESFKFNSCDVAL